MVRRHGLFIGGLVLGGFCLGVALHTIGAAAARTPLQRSPARAKPGTELLAVLAVSSDCGASRSADLPRAVRDIRRFLWEEAKREQKRFVSVGLSLDRDPWAGVEFLRGFGPFDEVLAGGQWLNTGSLAFIVRDLPGERALPQLVLVERDIEVDGVSIATARDRLVGRKVGADEIFTFAQLLAARATAQSTAGAVKH